jgi:hypothetical protein
MDPSNLSKQKPPIQQAKKAHIGDEFEEKKAEIMDRMKNLEMDLELDYFCNRDSREDRREYISELLCANKERSISLSFKYAFLKFIYMNEPKVVKEPVNKILSHSVFSKTSSATSFTVGIKSYANMSEIEPSESAEEVCMNDKEDLEELMKYKKKISCWYVVNDETQKIVSSFFTKLLLGFLTTKEIDTIVAPIKKAIQATLEIVENFIETVQEEEAETGGAFNLDTQKELDRIEATLKQICAEKNVILNLVPGEAKMIVHHLIFDETDTVSHYLHNWVGHKDIGKLCASSGASCKKKIELLIGIKEYQVNSSDFKEQFKNNSLRFFRAPELSEHLKKNKPTVVYIGYTQSADKILSMHWVPMTTYSATQKRLAAEEKLNKIMMDKNNKLLLRSPETNRENLISNISRAYPKMVEDEVRSFFPNYCLKDSENSLQFLNDRTLILCNDGFHGYGPVMDYNRGFLRHAFEKTKIKLPADELETKKSRMSLEKGSVGIDAFDEYNEKNWTEEILDMKNNEKDMAIVDDYSRRGLKDVDTLKINVDDRRVSTSVIPCEFNNNYYQFNNCNNQIIINYDSRKENRLVNSLYHFIDKLAVETDPEVRNALRDESYEINTISRKKKRKANQIRQQQEQEQQQQAEDQEVKKLSTSGQSIENPDLTLLQVCKCCGVERTLAHFFTKSKDKVDNRGVTVKCGYLRQFCHGCINKNNRQFKNRNPGKTRTKKRKIE